jgi:tRNA modification GTPase
LGQIGTEVADEIVLAVKGVQPVPWLELHGHGGREVVRLLLDLFRAHGFQECSWQEFLSRTGDPLRAAAAVALTAATTVRTASILLDQYHGAFGAALAVLVADLDAGRVEKAGERLAELLRFAPLGARLKPWRVVLAGAPNVGKSSLLNALAGYQRSIVAATPGTTRDVVTTRTALDGWPVELADTAGQRSETDDLEGQGIRKARETAAAADLCLWVLDASTEPVWPNADAGSVRLVVNKTDLAATWDLSKAGDAPRVSARTGEGIAELCGCLAQWLVPDPPPPGAAVPFTPELIAGITEARCALQAGRMEEARRILSLLGIEDALGSPHLPGTAHR